MLIGGRILDSMMSSMACHQKKKEYVASSELMNKQSKERVFIMLKPIVYSYTTGAHSNCRMKRCGARAAHLMKKRSIILLLVQNSKI